MTRQTSLIAYTKVTYSHHVEELTPEQIELMKPTIKKIEDQMEIRTAHMLMGPNVPIETWWANIRRIIRRQNGWDISK